MKIFNPLFSLWVTNIIALEELYDNNIEFTKAVIINSNINSTVLFVVPGNLCPL